ncbi:tetratricopeptide repeat protein [Roseateles sp.]|uniref:tetratricopeptide repeat protein n=1 Tax=Roseateles sp. TaxID=1971397 RepID=UPI003BA453C2
MSLNRNPSSLQLNPVCREGVSGALDLGARMFGLGLVLVVTLGFSAGAKAKVFKDAALQQALEASDPVALERLGQQRLAAASDDVEGLVARAWGLSLGFDGKQLDGALKLAEQCLAGAPNEAICHLALAQVQGKQVLLESRLKGVSLLPKVRASLGRALELNPDLYEARSKLAQIYLLIPEFLGGSVRKARDLEQAIRSKQPEQARLLRSLIAARQDAWDEAERELMAVRVGSDAALAEDVRNAYGELGRHWIKAKQFDRVKRLYEQLQKDQPTQAAASYYLGRLAQELDQNAEAVRHFEKALSLAGADSLPIDHRLGDALVSTGQTDKARLVYKRYIESKRAEPGHLKDARKKLAALG